MKHPTHRITTALAAGALLVTGVASAAATPAPKPAPTPRKPPAIETSIAMAVNGDELPLEPAPRIVGKGGGRLVVPVVRIYNALGISVARVGNQLIASAPGKRIVITVGSSSATIDGVPIQLQAPAMRIDATTYVPLRFLADSLGAQATFNARANRVEVVSSLVGRNPGLEQRAAGGAAQIVGTVTAVDLNSAPQTLTVQRGASVRTIAINSDAKVELQDVIARTSTPATFADVHPGDAVSALVQRDGRVDSIIVRYASRIGTIAAVSNSQFVLNTGFIVSPDASTTTTLNGRPATLGDLRTGDSVVVRLNPDTNEEREIIVARAVAVTQTVAGPTAITAFTIDAAHALRAGDSFGIMLRGTPNGRATFDIGTYITGLPLRESDPGVYTGRFTVPPDVNFGETSVYGHLSADGADAPRAQAPTLIAVSSTPPQIIDIAPLNGQNVNNDKPSIYATFRAPTGVAVNPSTAQISVNGLDVTPSATRTDQFIIYSPGVAINNGPVNVQVRVADQAGNVQTRSWSFIIRTH